MDQLNQNMGEALNSIYRDNLNYLARWNTILANHVSMAAAAMYLMKYKAKISPQKLYDDAKAYTQKLTQKRTNDAGIELGKLPWRVQRQLLGQDDLQESWQSFFSDVLNSNTDTEISNWLHRLGSGLSAAAGHSIIRIHYAMAVKDVLAPSTFKAELAVSFADLASRYTELTRKTEITGEVSLEDFLDRHKSLPESAMKVVNSGALIEDRFLLLKTQSSYQTACREIALDFDLVQCLRRLAFLATETANFTLLHATTVGQALLDIWKCYPELDDLPMRRGYRDYVVATVLGCDLPNTPSPKGSRVSIDDVYSKVPELRNDHSQKVTYSLTRLYDEFGYPEFLSAANHYQVVFG